MKGYIITTKKKMTVILLFILFGCLTTAFGWFEPKKLTAEQKIEAISELSNRWLGGLQTKMPDTSAKIFFESLLGVSLSGYRSFQTMDEVLYALRSGTVSSIWVPDLTAYWLLRNQKDLRELKTPDPQEERFLFALALKPEKEQLRDELNKALLELKQNGQLNELIASYLTTGNELEPFYPEDMKVNQKQFSAKDTIYIGVTGATPPLDLLDTQDRPYGFCVAFMDEIGQIMNRKVTFVVLSNESAFSSLMSGRVDAIFCWGSGESTLDPGTIDTKRSYITTEGYYPMRKYVFLTLN